MPNAIAREASKRANLRRGKGVYGDYARDVAETGKRMARGAARGFTEMAGETTEPIAGVMPEAIRGRFRRGRENVRRAIGPTSGTTEEGVGEAMGEYGPLAASLTRGLGQAAAALARRRALRKTVDAAVREGNRLTRAVGRTRRMLDEVEKTRPAERVPRVVGYFPGRS